MDKPGIQKLAMKRHPVKGDYSITVGNKKNMQLIAVSITASLSFALLFYLIYHQHLIQHNEQNALIFLKSLNETKQSLIYI